MSEQHNSLVVKSNALVDAMSDMGLQELRFLAFAASQLPHDLQPEPGKPYDMEIDVQALAETFQMESKSAYREVKNLADRLMRKVIEFDDEAGCEVAVGLISKRKYHRGEGRLWFRFDEDLLPHLMGLTERFTSYRLKDVYQFQKPSSWRIYELLKAYKKIGKREIELEELRWILGLVEKYPRSIDLRKWVVDPAIAEINATSDIKVQYDQRKRGRRVVALVFHIVDNEETKSTQEKIREKVKKELSKDECIAPEFAKFLREEYHMYPKQAKELANLAAKQDQLEEAKKKLREIRKRWEKAPDVNPKTGKAKKLGGYCFNALKRELTQTSLFDKK